MIELLSGMGLALFGVSIGSGLVLMGAAGGIGKIASSAVEGIARQPEAGAKIQTAMLIAAALIEGVAFFALIVCLLMGYASSGLVESAQKAPTAVEAPSH
ncbi:MAG: ATP synthase F0 subunit C [Planctomycetes bacterium]|nr:ATP synthase F0 subunit C [Planctomycetota bacterium]